MTAKKGLDLLLRGLQLKPSTLIELPPEEIIEILEYAREGYALHAPLSIFDKHRDVLDPAPEELNLEFLTDVSVRFQRYLARHLGVTGTYLKFGDPRSQDKLEKFDPVVNILNAETIRPILDELLFDAYTGEGDAEKVVPLTDGSFLNITTHRFTQENPNGGQAFLGVGAYALQGKSETDVILTPGVRRAMELFHDMMGSELLKWIRLMQGAGKLAERPDIRVQTLAAEEAPVASYLASIGGSGALRVTDNIQDLCNGQLINTRLHGIPFRVAAEQLEALMTYWPHNLNIFKRLLKDLPEDPGEVLVKLNPNDHQYRLLTDSPILTGIYQTVLGFKTGKKRENHVLTDLASALYMGLDPANHKKIRSEGLTLNTFTTGTAERLREQGIVRSDQDLYRALQYMDDSATEDHLEYVGNGSADPIQQLANFAETLVVLGTLEMAKDNPKLAPLIRNKLLDAQGYWHDVALLGAKKVGSGDKLFPTGVIRGYANLGLTA